MEDKIDKLYSLVENMYSNLSSKIEILQEGQKDLQESQKKLQITQEQMQSKLEIMAEVQQSHFEGQDRTNKLILGKLERLETANLENQTAIYNIKKAK